MTNPRCPAASVRATAVLRILALRGRHDRAAARAVAFEARRTLGGLLLARSVA